MAGVFESFIRYKDGADWCLAHYEKLDSRVQAAMNDVLLEQVNSLLGSIHKAESPIEQLLIVALNPTLFGFEYDKDIGVIQGYRVQLQEEVKTRRGLYRVDILITVTMPGGRALRLAVECDGHAFHEKTKEQAAHDKQRDRALAEIGLRMLRFTGSEIWRDPWACAEEVCGVLRTMISERES